MSKPLKANNLINNLIDYMLIDTKNNFNNKTIIDKTIPENKKNKKMFYEPKQQDTLFWCFYYIFCNANSINNNLDNKYFKIEKDFKIEFIEILRKNKELIKIKKLKITEIENELLNEVEITKNSLFALCLYYEYNIILVINKIYYTLTGNNNKDSVDGYIILDSKQYKLLLENDELVIKNKLKAESINKPIKSISAYKVDEIRNIAKTLDISIQKKNKTTIYNDILLDLQL